MDEGRNANKYYRTLVFFGQVKILKIIHIIVLNRINGAHSSLEVLILNIAFLKQTEAFRLNKYFSCICNTFRLN